MSDPLMITIPPHVQPRPLATPLTENDILKTNLPPLKGKHFTWGCVLLKLSIHPQLRTHALIDSGAHRYLSARILSLVLVCLAYPSIILNVSP